jgi:hypothetical protein
VARRSRARVLASVERALRIEVLSPDDRAAWENAVRAFRGARAAIDSDAANDWKLPADALAKAADARKQREAELRSALEKAMVVAKAPKKVDEVFSGDLELAMFPTRTGWLGFATTDAGAIAYPRRPARRAKTSRRHCSSLRPHASRRRGACACARTARGAR